VTVSEGERVSVSEGERGSREKCMYECEGPPPWPAVEANPI